MKRAAYPEGRFEFENEAWHRLYWEAWETLRFDRHYGAMGGQGPIPYTTIRTYASDNGITGEDFGLFRTFMLVIDSEWLKYVTECEKKEGDKDGRRSQA